MYKYIASIINFWDNILSFLSLLLWANITYTVLLIFVIFVIILIVMYVVLSKLASKILLNKKQFVYECDNLFYHIAASQYKTWLKAKDAELQDEHLAIIKQIFELKDPNYVWNIELIKSGVEKIEKKLWKKITHKNVWDNIDLYASKIKKLVLWYKILKFILILVLATVIGGVINYYI